MEKLFNYINELIENMGTSNISCKLIDNKDYTLVLNKYFDNYNKDYYNTTNLNINFFLDDFYFNKESNSIFINSRNNLLKIVSTSLKKIYKKLEKYKFKIKRM